MIFTKLLKQYFTSLVALLCLGIILYCVWVLYGLVYEPLIINPPTSGSISQTTFPEESVNKILGAIQQRQTATVDLDHITARFATTTTTDTITNPHEFSE